MKNNNKNIKEQRVTNNIKALNKDLKKLKKVFPRYFDKNGDFDFEKFKKELSKSEIDFSKESYGMDWLGKSYARLLASDEATTLLRENEEWNKKKENKNSENILIEGDNLEALKHLYNAYYEKIKMIYIDPPYNTGSDGFVYQDDRKFTYQELSKLAGIDEEKAKRILDFTQSKSNSHSAWLTFMYPQLYIAKQFLKDDGVIFVSIDDNEVAQLRLLMDEIFGEENFVGNLIWHKKDNASFLSNDIVNLKEYILFYKKTKLFDGTKDRLIDINKHRELITKPSRVDTRIFDKNHTLIENGQFSGRLKAGKYGSKMFGMKILKDVYIKNGIPNDDIEIKGRFCWSQKTIDEEISNGGRIEIKSIRGMKPIFYKNFGDNIPFRPLIDILSKKIDKRITTNNDAANEIKEYFGFPAFEYSKPSGLMKLLTDSVTKNDKNAIILDFFAGSGTTGDAVMQLNAEDGGNRKYILVQLPEEIDKKKNKTAYDFVKNELKVEKPTIFEICKERLIRAGKKIRGDNEKLKEDEKKDISNVDFGFKIFETTPIWEDYNFEAEEFDPQTTLFDESKLKDEDLKILLTTWKTYDGIALTQNLQKIDLDGYKGHYFDTKLYLVNKGFKTKNLKKLLEEIDKNKAFNPASIVAFGYNFESKALREIAENVKSYANKKQIDIDFIMRY